MSRERIGLAGRQVGAGALVVVLALGLGACGRRGPLEPPSPDPAAAKPPATAPSGRATPADARLRPTASSGTPATPATLATRQGSVVADSSDDEEEEAVESPLSVSPTPTPRKRVRPYTVPKDSFFLDPLL